MVIQFYYQAVINLTAVTSMWSGFTSLLSGYEHLNIAGLKQTE